MSEEGTFGKFSHMCKGLNVQKLLPQEQKLWLYYQRMPPRHPMSDFKNFSDEDGLVRKLNSDLGKNAMPCN